VIGRKNDMGRQGAKGNERRRKFAKALNIGE
jgi:hypothetical protein